MSRLIRILFVGDEANFSELLGEGLYDLEIAVAENGEDAIVKAESQEAGYKVVVMDRTIEYSNALEIMLELQWHDPAIQVIIIADQFDVELGENAMRLGAFRYMNSPVNTKELILNIRYAATLGQEHRPGFALQALVGTGERIGVLWGQEDLYQKLYSEAQKLLPFLDGFLLSQFQEDEQVVSFPFSFRHGERIAIPDRRNGNKITEYVLKTKKPLLLANGDEKFRKEKKLDPPTSSLGYCTSEIAVPIFLDGRIIGTINALTYEPGVHYSYKHLQVLQAFANQVAVELGISTQLEEAKQLRKVALMLAGKRGKDEVLRAIVEGAHELIGSDYNGLILQDSGGVLYRVKPVIPEDYFEQFDEPRQQGGITRFVVDSRQPRVIPDTDLDPLVKDSVRAHGIRSMLALPLIYGDLVLGVLFAHTSTYRRFNEHDINLWRAFASQAATALQSAQEEERYIRDYTRLANELGKLNEKMNLGDTMVRLATAGKTIFESDTCRLALVDPATASVEGWEWAEGDLVEFRHESPPRADGVTNYVLQTGEPVFRSVGDSDKPQPVPELVAKGLKSFASLPLVYSGRKIGILHCNYLTKQQPFDQHLQTLMEAFGARAAMALDRARRDKISEVWRELDHQTITGEDYKTSYQIFMEKLHAVLHTAFSELYFYRPSTSAGKLVPAGMETVFMGNRPTLWRFSEDGCRKQLIREIEQVNSGILIVNDLEKQHGSPYSNWVRRREIGALVAMRLDVILKEQPDSGMAGLLVMGFQKPTNFELGDLVELQYAGNFIAANILRRHLQIALQNATEQRNQQLRSVVSIFREFVRYGRALSLDFIAERSIEILGIDTCSLLEYDEQKGAFIQRGTAGNRYPEVPYSLPEDKFKMRFVDAKEPLEIADVRSDELTKNSKYVEREAIKSVMVFPLRVEEKFLGLFFANYRDPRILSSDVKEAMGLFADLAALVLHESQLGATLMETEQRLTRRVFLDKVSLIEAAWRHTLIQKASAIRNHVAFLQKYIERHVGDLPWVNRITSAVADIDRIAAKILDAPPRVPQSFEVEEYVRLVPVLNEVTHQIGEQLRLNSDPSIEIVLDIDALMGIQVLGHAGRLSYALEALLQNSCKAMPIGGKIVISGTTSDRWVEIRIMDTGEGVPAEIQPTLYKVVLTKEQDSTGMGIGGVLAATIVEDHRGSITLERAGPGDTTVLVRLPIAEEALS